MSELRQHDVEEELTSSESNEPLITLPVDDQGVETAVYFTSEAAADEYVRKIRPQGPVSFAGIWSDLDADDMLDSLERIRHDSKPTPPLEDARGQHRGGSYA